MIRVVLVDDEPQSCKSLAIKLKDVAEDIEITGTYHDPERAISGIRKMKPAVVFLEGVPASCADEWPVYLAGANVQINQ